MSESIAIPVPQEPARACVRCRKVKPASAFHRAGPGRRRKVCASCRPSTRTRNLDTRNFRESTELKRSRLLWKEYGITLEQYDRMLSSQDGKCLLCNEPPRQGTNLHVDHCHDTGVVRGLLCGICNRQLGVFEALQTKAPLYLATYGRGNPLLKPALD